MLLPVKQSVDFFTRWSSSSALRDTVKAVLLDDTGESPVTQCEVGHKSHTAYVMQPRQCCWITQVSLSCLLSLHTSCCPTPQTTSKLGVSALKPL